MWHEYMDNKEEVSKDAPKKVEELPKELKSLKIDNIFLGAKCCKIRFFIPTTIEDRENYKFGDVVTTKASFSMEDVKFRHLKKIETVNLDKIDINISIEEDWRYYPEYKKIKITGALNLELICKTIIFKI